MKDWGQVIGWLNEYGRSHLDDECRSLFKQISDTTISASQRDDLINEVIQVGKSKSDPLISPEVLVLCSEYFFKRDRFTEARKNLNEAKYLYFGFKRSGRHRLFVTLWLLGMVEWKMVTHYAAHCDWKIATEIVNEIAEEEEGGPHDDMAQWYKEREEEMKVDLAGTAEETYTWLIFSKTGLFGNLRGRPEIPKEPETGYLSSELIQWRDAMIANIKDEKYDQVNLDIQKLIEKGYLSSELTQWLDAMIMNIKEKKYGQVYLDIQKLTEIVYLSSELIQWRIAMIMNIKDKKYGQVYLNIQKLTETGYLSSELIQWRDAMIANIKDKKYGQVYLDIQKLTEIVNKRSSSWEKAEIELACGLALHQMQNHEAAEKCVRHAVQMFSPYTHKVAVARWMLGIIQWRIESKRSEALNNWRKSIDDFSSLFERANTENKADRFTWYTNACAVLEKAMEQRIPY